MYKEYTQWELNNNNKLPTKIHPKLYGLDSVGFCSYPIAVKATLKHPQAPNVAMILSYFSESYDKILQAVLSHCLSVKQEDLSSACLFQDFS